ncbi:hypothetical protein M409DRAFT_52900 [Zasmidium cellare ATCC 36951]|uniref:Uncharacterized protein n=1 Tax=Zasmidium cellare ATCC 36951 TaxID=1080233 RepID=A0A6A6CSV9_ZASCE|nr:uncharacterized protein M409DRAFT_52900 [Zasmidium cellare ATCC 36951]KAF2168912.1 hypothetical protein M409DRAFT_52900 [Zasmidium cellare ATCC 36951]
MGFTYQSSQLIASSPGKSGLVLCVPDMKKPNSTRRTYSRRLSIGSFSGHSKAISNSQHQSSNCEPFEYQFLRGYALFGDTAASVPSSLLVRQTTQLTESPNEVLRYLRSCTPYCQHPVSSTAPFAIRLSPTRITIHLSRFSTRPASPCLAPAVVSKLGCRTHATNTFAARKHGMPDLCRCSQPMFAVIWLWKGGSHGRGTRADR